MGRSAERLREGWDRLLTAQLPQAELHFQTPETEAGRWRGWPDRQMLQRQERLGSKKGPLTGVGALF